MPCPWWVPSTTSLTGPTSGLRDFSTATARQPGSSSRTRYDVASTPASASKTPCCCPTASSPPATPTWSGQLMSSEPAGPDTKEDRHATADHHDRERAE